MSSTQTKWDKSGISIVIEPKSKSRKLSAGAYKLVTLDAFNASYINATSEVIASKGTRGIRVVNDGSVPIISNSSTFSILYTGYQGSAPPLLNWTEVPVSIDASGNFSLLVENTLPLAFYRLKLRLYDGVTQKDFAEKTITTPDDSVFTGLNDALSQLSNIGVDGWLSKGGEKLQVISRFNAAVADFDTLQSRAAVQGVSSVEFKNAFASLQGYLTGLNPAYTDTAQDTPIDSIVWLDTWKTFDTAKSKLQTALQGITKVDAFSAAALSGDVSSTPDLIVYSTPPTISGLTITDGAQVLVISSGSPDSSGIFKASVATSSGATLSLPALGVLTGSGTYLNDANARDSNPTTYATLTSPTSGTASAVYSGWSGSGTGGTLNVTLVMDCDNSLGAEPTGKVYYSTDAGGTWALFPSGSFTSSYMGLYTVSVNLSGINQANLRVRVDATGVFKRTKTWDTDSGGIWYFETYSGTTTALIKGVWLDTSAVSAGLTTMTRIATIHDGDTFFIAKGDTYPGKNVQAHWTPFDNSGVLGWSLSFTTSDPVFQQKLVAGANINISGDTISATTGGSASTYVHDQSSAAATWTINHNLGKFPSATVVDSAGTMGYGAVSYSSASTMVISFSAAFSGKAYLN